MICCRLIPQRRIILVHEKCMDVFFLHGVCLILFFNKRNHPPSPVVVVIVSFVVRHDDGFSFVCVVPI